MKIRSVPMVRVFEGPNEARSGVKSMGTEVTDQITQSHQLRVICHNPSDSDIDCNHNSDSGSDASKFGCCFPKK